MTLSPTQLSDTITSLLSPSQKNTLTSLIDYNNQALVAAVEAIKTFTAVITDPAANTRSRRADRAIELYQTRLKEGLDDPEIFSAMARANIAIENIVLFQKLNFIVNPIIVRDSIPNSINDSMTALVKAYNVTVAAFAAFHIPLSQELQNAFDQAQDTFTDKTIGDADALAAIEDANAVIAIADRSLLQFFKSSASHTSSALQSDTSQCPLTEEILRDQAYPLGTAQKCDSYQFYNLQKNLLYQELHFNDPILLIAYEERTPDGSVLQVIPVDTNNWEDEKLYAFLFDDAPTIWLADQTLFRPPPTSNSIPASSHLAPTTAKTEDASCSIM